MERIANSRELYRALFKLMLSVQNVLAILQEEVFSEELSEDDFGQNTRHKTHQSEELLGDHSSANSSEEISISFLDRRGKVPETSRLNMGFSDHYRNHQAAIYINRLSWSFFPEPQIPFTVNTDDGKAFTCKISGMQSRHLVTVGSYRILSEYIRGRLNVSLETQITREMLEQYGRTDVTFRREGNEYSLDFSVK